jgi:hypothetical protein
VGIVSLGLNLRDVARLTAVIVTSWLSPLKR